MKGKIILALGLLILMISLCGVTAENNSSDDVLSDELPAAGDVGDPITVKVVWSDSDSSKRSDSVKFHFEVDGNKVGDTYTVSKSDQWQITVTNLQIPADDFARLKVVEDDVASGYTSNVIGDAKGGFTITNTLKETPTNDTNKTEQKKADAGVKEPVKKTVKKTTTTKTTTKKVPAKTETKKTNNTNKTKDKHNTGNPILLGVLALSVGVLAYNFRRKE